MQAAAIFQISVKTGKSFSKIQRPGRVSLQNLYLGEFVSSFIPCDTDVINTRWSLPCNIFQCSRHIISQANKKERLDKNEGTFEA